MTRSRAMPQSVAVACLAAVLSAIPLVAATRSVSYQFPDYGDLWRWSMLIHIDDSLTIAEVFSETNLIGHNHVVTIWLSSIASGSGDYSLLWRLGAVGVALSAAALAYIAHSALVERGTSSAVSAIVALGISLLAFRFDEGVAYFSSLLVFEQLFYFFALGSLLIGASLQARQAVDNEAPWLGYAVLGLFIFLGEAPTALSLVALLGLAVLGTAFWRDWTHLARLAVVALVGTVAKWVLRTITGGKSAPNGPDSTFSFLDPRAIPDWLKMTGASFRAFVEDRKAPAPHSLYLVIGTAMFAIMALALVFCLVRVRSKTLDRPTLQLALSGILLIAFSILAAMFIIDTRPAALNGRYDLNRFVRSTQFTMPGVALVLLASATSKTSWSRRIQPILPVLLAVCLIARLGPAREVQDAAIFQERFAENRDALVCEPAVEDVEWSTLWMFASDELGTKFGESPLFEKWRADKCP